MPHDDQDPDDRDDAPGGGALIAIGVIAILVIIGFIVSVSDG
ncbi:hypothetical protein ACFFX1_49605 [Dactylosporangium sucinum]|uniref:Uncharacterized protein n=1 Tax=Dactylosporangium sucinum TaxID=1424081 RepID=A0A917TXS1_9ACTN|nr:hypothetical protein [Dactylosporangium sucinum]GGM42608.1 hypothetical protein GCM10007977_050180 [Dactylosporangium sucinum]